MRIQILSDLHLERYRYFGTKWDIPESDADVVVLAGDIDVGTHGVLWAAEQAERLGKQILYVPGNHEYWGEDVFELPKALRAAAKGTRVTLLDNAEVVIDDTRFIGGTLWTNFGNGKLMDVAIYAVNDYRKITANRWWNNARNRQRAARHWGDIDKLTGSFIPTIALEQHRKCLHFIRERLDIPFHGNTVVVTHHAPTWESLRRSGIRDLNLNDDRLTRLRFSPDSELPIIASYASDLDDLLSEHRDVIDVWIHGHIHESLDYVHHGIRISTNPHGYLLRYNEDLKPQVWLFNPLHMIVPSEGVSPVLSREFNEPLAQLDSIFAEAQAYAAYTSSSDKNVAKMAAYYLLRLANEFNEQMRLIVVPLLTQLLARNLSNEDDVLAYMLFENSWDVLFGPRSSLSVTTHFCPIDDDDASAVGVIPHVYAQRVIKDMTELRKLMHEKLPTVLAGERYSREQLHSMRHGPHREDSTSEW